MIKVNNTPFNDILAGQYKVTEDIPVILATKTMADGTEKRNIASKKKTKISLQLGKISGDVLVDYLGAIQDTNTVQYYSPKYQINKSEQMYCTSEIQAIMDNMPNDFYNELTLEFVTI